jgi:chromosome segregation protein
MLPIGLLSGGQRTMTALALLFSVFESRPSPFCVLDEVDAALDDANVQRFLAMLDTFRSTTQFLVVTHNKGTMAHAQRLYGVTMQTKGVSHQVEVDFSEVDDFVPDTAEVAGRKELQRIEDPPPVPEIPRLREYEEPELAKSVDTDTGEPVVELTPAERTEDPVATKESGGAAVVDSAAGGTETGVKPLEPSES